MNRRHFLKLTSAGTAFRAIPTSAAFIIAQSSAIRLGLLARAQRVGSRAWYAIVDEAIELSASFPKTKGALFTLFGKAMSKSR